MQKHTHTSSRALVLGAGLVALFSPSAGCSAVIGTDFVADGLVPGAAGSATGGSGAGGGAAGSAGGGRAGAAGTGTGGSAGTAGAGLSAGSSGAAGTSGGGSAGSSSGGDAGSSSGGDAGTSNGGNAGTSNGGNAGTSSGGAGTSGGGNAGTSSGGNAGTSSGGNAGTSGGGNAGTSSGGNAGTGGASGSTTGGSAGSAQAGAAGAGGGCDPLTTIWYRDSDGDGFVRPLADEPPKRQQCARPGDLPGDCPASKPAPCTELWIAEAAAVFGDCDDGAATTYPGAWDGPKVPLQPAGLNAPGFLAEFFALPPGATMPPELSMLTKLLSRQDVVVELFPGYASVGPTLPRDIAARWTGTLRIPVAGAYSFEVESDDGFRLYVGDGAPLHDEWTATSGLTRNDPKQLEVNTAIPIRLEWFDLRQVAKIRLWWSGPGFAKRRLTVALDATPSQAIASCDSVDNDCDGQKDEDVFSLPAVGGVVPDLRLACANVCQPFDAPIYQHGKACGTGPGPEHLGACHPGFTYCRPNGTWSDCADDAPIAAAGPEVCGNFEDDDCDGQVNEDCP